MKPKTMILMVLAVACGLGASFMTSKLLAERQTDEKEKLTVLSAKKDLDLGLIVKNPQDLFETKQIDKDGAPKEIIEVKDPAQLEEVLLQFKNRSVKMPRARGDLVMLGHFYDKDGVGIMGNLPAGYRAVGIRVNMESIAGGFASLPHSRVDLIMSVRRGDDKSTFSKILLENVLVLAADAVSNRPTENQAMPASVVTLALTPEEMLKVNIAKEQGAISLALRRFGDTKKYEGGKMTYDTVLTGQKTPDDEDAIEAGNPGSGGPPGALHGVGFKKKTDKTDVVAQAPKDAKYGTYSLTITEGESQRRMEYTTDLKTGEVIPREVIRTDLDAPTAIQAGPGAPAAPKTGNGTGAGWGGNS